MNEYDESQAEEASCKQIEHDQEQAKLDKPALPEPVTENGELQAF